jgi:hypothetical protein
VVRGLGDASLLPPGTEAQSLLSPHFRPPSAPGDLGVLFGLADTSLPGRHCHPHLSPPPVRGRAVLSRLRGGRVAGGGVGHRESSRAGPTEPVTLEIVTPSGMAYSRRVGVANPSPPPRRRPRPETAFFLSEGSQISFTKMLCA